MDEVKTAGETVARAGEAAVKAVADVAKETIGAVSETVGAVSETVGAVTEKVAETLAGKDERLPLPEDRAQLLALHQAARRRRDAAPLDSEARVEALLELERIEIQVARVERAMDPPRV